MEHLHAENMDWWDHRSRHHRRHCEPHRNKDAKPTIPVSHRELRSQSIVQPTWLLPQPSKNKDCDPHRGTARNVHVVTFVSGHGQEPRREKPPARTKGIPEIGRFLGRCPLCAGPVRGFQSTACDLRPPVTWKDCDPSRRNQSEPRQTGRRTLEPGSSRSPTW